MDTPFSSVRLSKHFTLLDFLHGHTLYSGHYPLHPNDIPPGCIRTGQRLCEELLEPIIRMWGPISIANGFIPRSLLSSRWTPHSWYPADGAAADIAVHDWVNAGYAPIKLVESMVMRALPYERLITYAGSEFICVSAGRSPKNRGAVYENVRVPGQASPRFIVHSRGGKPPELPMEDRPDWRREENEPIYHTMRQLRPQHLRVSRYFTALDFCRDEPAIEAGRAWVPRFATPSLVDACRCVGEVLDTIVRQVGRISIVRGITRPDKGASHSWDGPELSVDFLLPMGADVPSARHAAILSMGAERHLRNKEVLCRMSIERFKPEHIWSSAQVSKSNSNVY